MLETPRLLLRPIRIEDAKHLMDLNADPDVVRFTGDPGFKNLLEAELFIKDKMIPQFQLHKMSRFLVFLKDGSFTGWCGLKFHPETNEVDLGYRFLKKFWGQGLATESSNACIDYGFNELNLNRIIAKAMPENISSIKVMQKLKMTFRGYVNDPTDPHSFVLYDLTKEEYLKCANS